MRYEGMQLERALENIKTEARDINRVDVLRAMGLSTRAWSNIPSPLVGKCLYRTYLFVGDEETDFETAEMLAAPDLQHQIDELVLPRKPICIDVLLNSRRENDCL